MQFCDAQFHPQGLRYHEKGCDCVCYIGLASGQTFQHHKLNVHFFKVVVLATLLYGGEPGLPCVTILST